MLDGGVNRKENETVDDIPAVVDDDELLDDDVDYLFTSVLHRCYIANLSSQLILRQALNSNNEILEVQAISENHNCPTDLQHLGLSDRKLQRRLTRKIDQLQYHCLLANIRGLGSITSNTKIYWPNYASGTANWMKALPTSPRFPIPRDEFRTVVAMHMLLPEVVLLGMLGLRSELRKVASVTLGKTSRLARIT